MLLSAGHCLSQNNWPKSIYPAGGSLIHIYKPQVDSLAGNIMKCKSTISLSDKSSNGPVFGVVWTTDTVEIDQAKRQVTIRSVKVDDLRIPADNGFYSKKRVKEVLEVYIPKAIKSLSLDDLLASLDGDREEANPVAGNRVGQSNLIFRRWAAMLVPIYGDPIFRNSADWGLEMVVNTPFTIVKAKDGMFYCYAAGKWYVAPVATGPYAYTDNKVSRPLRKIARGLDKAAKKNGEPSAEATGNPPVYDIIVSTAPAQLIQTDGDPVLTAVDGTSLQYVTNSGDAILLDTVSRQYYALVSGRWIRSSELKEGSQWQYVGADELPRDFAKIPPNSPVGDVLASVAGTKQAKEAALDAQIPQVARIDRINTTTQIEYDGAPRFEPIAGTNLQYAVNSCSAVIGYKGNYYAVDEGVWFFSDNAMGPWTVSIARPAGMDLIPRDCPVYGARFVHIYQVTTDYVYDGYTAGYLNSDMGNCALISGQGFGEDDKDEDFGYGWGFDGGFDVLWTGGGGFWGRGARADFWRARRFRYDRHRGYDGRMAIRGRRGPQEESGLLTTGRATAVTGGATRVIGGATRMPGGVTRGLNRGSGTGGRYTGGVRPGNARPGGVVHNTGGSRTAGVSGRSGGGGGSARSGGYSGGGARSGGGSSGGGGGTHH
jgi:hypothetical protein